MNRPELRGQRDTLGVTAYVPHPTNRSRPCVNCNEGFGWHLKVTGFDVVGDLFVCDSDANRAAVDPAAVAVTCTRCGEWEREGLVNDEGRCERCHGSLIGPDGGYR